MGLLTLSVTLPEGSNFKSNDLGVYFRVLSGTAPDKIFPELPLISVSSDPRNLLGLYWLDGAPDGRTPLNLKVEAFFVGEDLGIGPTTVFELKDP
jgi:hypothetical protein